ncbi:TetR family transcriptional regulator [Nocardiopsis coralliicola]
MSARPPVSDRRARSAGAAARLIAGHGCAAATWESVGASAGVDAAEVRGLFGGRSALIDAAVRRAGGPDGRTDAAWIDAALHCASGAEQLRLQAEGTGRMLHGAARVLEGVRLSAADDPDAAHVWRCDLGRRRSVARLLAVALSAKAPLRPGLTADRAADVSLTVLGPEVYALLTDDRGWSHHAWTAWSRGALTRLLCPAARS